MSAFDDEFGLFSETVVDEPQPIGEGYSERSRAGQSRPAKPAPSYGETRPEQSRSGQGRRSRDRRERRPNVSPGDPWAGHRRATELLGFMARKLVQKPEAVTVELFIDEQSQPVIELVVDPEDLGKVIGRSGRVAHALRTVVRATAESRVSVDILDTEEAAEDPDAASESE